MQDSTKVTMMTDK